jgi:hypothetical protein
MKKTTRRLALARETIQQLSGIELSGDDLGRVAGGLTSQGPLTACCATNQVTCRCPTVGACGPGTTLTM